MAEPFAPAGAVQCAATGTSSTYALPTRLGRVVRYYVNGTAPVWVKTGDSGVIADANTCMCLCPGAVELISLAGNPTHVAVITDGSADSTLNVTVGNGDS